MIAVVYTRVSTVEQTQNLSLPTQERACREYCKKEGLEVAEVFTEQGESAKTANRTQLQALLAYCRENKKRVRFVVVYNLSRFSRDARVHLALTGALAGWGITLRSVTEPIDNTPTGRFVETMIAGIAQLDNETKAERTKVGMRAALESGRWTFQAPTGFRSGMRGGPSLLPDEPQADLLKHAFEKLASGRATKRSLLGWLRARGFRTRRGAPLSAQSLAALLKNPLYAGRIEVSKWGISTRGDFEPIVSEDVFGRVQARLAGRTPEARTYARSHPDFPLRRFVRCGSCHRPMTGSRSRGRSSQHAYYHCTHCHGVRSRKADFEQAFTDLLAQLRPRPEFMTLFRAIVLDAWKERQASSRESRRKLEAHVEALRRRLDRIDEAFIYDKAIDRQSYERQRDRLREQLALAECDLAEEAREQLDVEAVLGFAEHVLCNAARLWEQASLDQKQRLQASLFPEGLTFDGSGFGTAVTCVAFAQLPVAAAAQDGLASPTGFEPSGHCGSTWRDRAGEGGICAYAAS